MDIMDLWGLSEINCEKREVIERVENSHQNLELFRVI
jgi:hypothetical protein